MKLQRLIGRRVLVGLAVVALVVAAAVSASGPTVNQQIRVANAPDLILYNGVISTLDGSNSTVRESCAKSGSSKASSAVARAISSRGPMERSTCSSAIAVGDCCASNRRSE